MGFLSGVAGAIGGVVSTVLGNNSSKKEAEKNREWQEQMSNTSISRRMQDLRNAGLNPLLAVENASSGASTPSGSQAQIERFNPQWITALSSAKLQQAEAKKTEAEAKAVDNDNSLHQFRVEQMELMAKLEREKILTEKTVQAMNKQSTLEGKARVMVAQAQRENVKMTTEQAKRNIQMLDIKLNGITSLPVVNDAVEFGKSFNNLPSVVSGGVGSLIGGFYHSGKYLYNKYKDYSSKKVVRNIKYRGYN